MRKKEKNTLLCVEKKVPKYTRGGERVQRAAAIIKLSVNKDSHHHH